jgi:hypothetical protein
MRLLFGLALLAASAGGNDVSLAIKASQKEGLVGEPVKLVVTWTAGGRPLNHLYVEDSEFLGQALTFLVEDGVSRTTHRELSRAPANAFRPPSTLRRVNRSVEPSSW